MEELTTVPKSSTPAPKTPKFGCQVVWTTKPSPNFEIARLAPWTTWYAIAPISTSVSSDASTQAPISRPSPTRSAMPTRLLERARTDAPGARESLTPRTLKAGPRDLRAPFTKLQQRVSPEGNRIATGPPRGALMLRPLIAPSRRKGTHLNRKRLASFTLLAVLAGTATSLTTSAGAAPTATEAAGGDLTGAGSTLIAPLMAQWKADVKPKYGINLTYGSVGSGAGIAQITARTVDFGASDAPLTPAQASACNQCFHELGLAGRPRVPGFALDRGRQRRRRVGDRCSRRAVARAKPSSTSRRLAIVAPEANATRPG